MENSLKYYNLGTIMEPLFLLLSSPHFTIHSLYSSFNFGFVLSTHSHLSVGIHVCEDRIVGKHQNLTNRPTSTEPQGPCGRKK